VALAGEQRKYRSNYEAGHGNHGFDHRHETEIFWADLLPDALQVVPVQEPDQEGQRKGEDVDEPRKPTASEKVAEPSEEHPTQQPDPHD
jgi:hypothetical protein